MGDIERYRRMIGRLEDVARANIVTLASACDLGRAAGVSARTLAAPG
jgi:hypothetical protein